MYLKISSSVLISIFLLPILASAQIKPGPSNLVCVIDADESPADLAAEAGWKDPNVQGFLIRQSWAALEPTEGNFDFRLFDQAVQLAQQNGKFIGLQLGAGSLSPKWVFAAGAEPLISAQAGPSQKTTMPWDPIFQSAWAAAIEQLGNRYDANPAVAYVVMSGLGRGFDSSLAQNADDVAKFDAAGGELFWTRASNLIGDLYTASFPHTQVIMPVDAPVPGRGGEKMAAAVAVEQIQTHPDQFGLETASSSAEDAAEMPPIVSSTSAPTGVNLDGAMSLPEKLAAAEQSGLLQRATFLQINSHQAQRDDLQDVLSNAADQLSSASGNNPGGLVTTSAKVGGSSSKRSSANSLSSSRKSGNTSVLSAAADAANQIAIKAAALAAAYSGRPIWLSPNASGGSGVGTGTQADPLCVPTAEDLDSALFQFSNVLTPNLVFHLLPGTFYTRGNPGEWAMSTGWQFLGSGENTTTLRIDPSYMTYTATNKEGDNKVVINTNGLGNIIVKDMTLDANCTAFGSKLTSTFVMPAPRATVSVRVEDSSTFTVGKWVYLQDSAPTAGINLAYGLMEVAGIQSATRITLKNTEIPTSGPVTGTLTAGSPVITNVSSVTNLDEHVPISGPGIPAGTQIKSVGNGTATMYVNATASGTNVSLTHGTIALPGSGGDNYCPEGNVAPGTVLPKTTRLLVAACFNGIFAGRNNDTMENLMVENVGRPFYEGPSGIGLNGYNTCNGTLVQNCTVKNIWGLAGWIISMSNTKGVSLIGNSIYGNGYSQAYSFVSDNSNCTMTNNSAENCIVGIFSDTGLKSNITVTGNQFHTQGGIDLAGAQFTHSTFSQNYFQVTQSYSMGMMFYGLAMTDCTFSHNTIDAAPNIKYVWGVNFNPNCYGSARNVFSNNVVNSTLVNSRNTPSFGTESGNVDQNGIPISFGLTP